MPGTASPRAANYLPISSNTPPVLAPIGNKVIYLGQTLSFLASATDSDVPAQVLTFSLDSNGLTDGDLCTSANITGAGAFTWTPCFLGMRTVIVRVSDNGIPPLNDSETITVEVLAAPNFTSSLLRGSQIELTWSARTNKQYAVDYKDDLNAAQWMPLGTSRLAGGISGGGGNTNGSTNGMTNVWTNGFTFMPGGTKPRSDVSNSGNTLSFTNSITNSPQRFFRIRLVE
jgi:hypothetical protein